MKRIKNVLLLAGGDSTRFWPLKDKALTYFLGKPLIVHQIERLSEYAEKVTVVSHKDTAVTIKRLIDNLDTKSTCQVVIQKDDLTGQSGAILTVKNLIRGPVLILNAADFIDFTLISKLVAKANYQAKVILTGKKVAEYLSGGYFRMSADRKIVEIVEKPGADKMPSNVFRLVADYFFDAGNLIEAIESIKTKSDDQYEKAINKLISEVGSDYLITDVCVPLKYPWDVLKMLRSFFSEIKKPSIAKSAKISKTALIKGQVVIGENVIIGDYVKIVGPTFIGANSIVGDYSLIRESQIGDDCLIGSYTEVARSFIGNKVFLHRNYVGDSVLDDSTMMGAGAVTANLRFDTENVTSYVEDEKVDTGLIKLGVIVGSKTKIGVNSTTLPGIKIGKNSLVSPREIVRFDLGDNVYLHKGEERDNNI